MRKQKKGNVAVRQASGSKESFDHTAAGKRRMELNACGTYRFKRFVRKAYGAFCSMHKVVNIGVLASCMLAFVHVTSTSAQTGASQHPDKLLEDELEEVTVTASRVESPLSRAAKLVAIITKEQISQAPVQSIQDLLIYAANIDIIQRGGHGVQADISIRGGSADQTAVLLNGINLTNPHTGHYSFDIPINLSDIERIEIVHGPSALIYGSGAFSGGINIITKKNIDTPLYANVEAGMHGLRGGNVRGAFETGKTKNSLSVGYKASDGYIAHSDYKLYNMLWQTRLQMQEYAYLDFQLGYNNKQYGANTFYSAAYPNQYEHTATYMGSVKGSLGKTFKIIPILYWDRHYDRFDLIKNTTTGQNYHRGDTYGANLIVQYTSCLGVTNVGGEWRREDMLSSKLGKPMVEAHGRYTNYDDRTNTGITLEHTWSKEYVIVSAGAMMNHNTLTDKRRLYPSVSAAYRPNQALKIYASWSQSTRVPTFTDLYYTTETHHANEQLKPERSESVDVGIQYNNTIISAYLTGYLMWGHDIIDWIRESGEEKWASWNMTELDKQGIEAGITFRLGKQWPALGKQTDLSINYARMHQTADAKGLESKYSLNYLRDKLTMQLHHPICKNLSAGWYFGFRKRMGNYRKYEGITDLGLHPYPSFSTLDLKLNYVYRKFNFHINLNNIYNTQYYDIGNISQAGCWLMGGITYRL